MGLTFTKTLANHLSLGVDAIGPLINGSGSVLVVAQVRPTSLDISLGDNTILVARINAAALGLLFNIGNASTVVRGAGRSQAADALEDRVATTTVTTGAWHTVATFLDFTADKILNYLDGALDNTNASTETFGSATYVHGAPSATDRIGKSQNEQANQQFAGDIEFTAIWRDITDTQAGQINSALQAGTKPYDITPAPVVCLVLGYATPDVCVMGSGVTSTITGSLPFIEGPTGLPPTADNRRLIIGGVASTAEFSGTAVTQDPDFISTITPSDTDIGESGLNTFVFPGHRIISEIESQSYAPALDPGRFWIAGIAAYKSDFDGGTSTPEPTIASSLTAETTEGAEFFYQIEATNDAFLYSASPLPTGLVADTDLGHITGTLGAGTADTYNVNLGATNDSGVGNATLVLTVHPAQPAPPGGVFKHKPLPMAIVATLGNFYHAPSSKL